MAEELPFIERLEPLTPAELQDLIKDTKSIKTMTDALVRIRKYVRRIELKQLRYKINHKKLQMHRDKADDLEKKIADKMERLTKREGYEYIDGKIYHRGLSEREERNLFKMKPRYQKIMDVIAEIAPRQIVEIGTCMGDTAKPMIVMALRYSKTVHYVGYDLFEYLTEDDNEFEYNGKQTSSYDEISAMFEQFERRLPPRRLKYELRKGNTNEVLQEHNVDLVWLDGGHSVETIANDFDKVKGSKVVILDDYYTEESGIDIEKYGCNSLIETLDPKDVEIFTSTRADGNEDFVGIAIWRNPKNHA